MSRLNLARFPRLSEQRAVETLNRLTKYNRRLMLHQVAVATACSTAEAMGMVYLLLDQKDAEAFILVYHTSDLTDPPVHSLRRPIAEGLPSLPLVCNICGNEIESPAELAFDLEFRVAEDIEFVSE